MLPDEFAVSILSANCAAENVFEVKGLNGVQVLACSSRTASA
jgi:hypothetical protein